MKGYTVDFDDGYRVLVDANNEAEARAFAIKQSTLPGRPPPKIIRCYCSFDAELN